MPGQQVVVLFLGLGVLAGCSPGPKPVPRPNIVLVTIDTLRADRVGVERGGRALTPAIDSFASASTVFANALTPIATTAPAHASLFTGRMPREHGVRWNGDALPVGRSTLAKVLQESGYETASFVSMPLLINGAKLGRGFEARSDLGHPVGLTRPGAEVNAMTKRWLAEPRDKPFFLWVHYYEVHSPYDLSDHARENWGEYDGLFKQGATVELFYESSGQRAGRAPKLDEDRRAMEGLYDGAVLEADELVGELLSMLGMGSGDGLKANNTAVIVTADHGQLLGEHDRVGHGFMVWEEALRIPMIIHAPGRERHVASPPISERVSLLDLYPTILEFAGLPIPEGLPGQSLVPTLDGAALESRVHLGDSRTGQPDRQMLMAISGKHKVIIRGEKSWAHDLEADPEELVRLPIEGNAKLEQLLKLIRGYESTGGGPSQEPPSQEVLEQLRKLGYTH